MTDRTDTTAALTTVPGGGSATGASGLRVPGNPAPLTSTTSVASPAGVTRDPLAMAFTVEIDAPDRSGRFTKQRAAGGRPGKQPVVAGERAVCDCRFE